MPEVAFAGTAHEPDSVQLPQSIRPVVASFRQLGWFCGSEAEGGTVATLRAVLKERFAARLSARLPPVAVAQAHRWRHARVVNPLGEPCLVDAGQALGFCGDWCLDARVEAAFLSGDALGAALVRDGGR